MIVNLRDQLSAFFWLGISVFVCLESYQNDIGSFQFPGPGFLPFWCGIALGAFALILSGKTWLEKREGIKIPDLWKGKEWDKVVLVLTSLVVYAILLQRLGYLITTLGLMTLLFRVKGRQRLLIQGVSALIAVLASYTVFYVWLKVPLPTGILGF